MGTKITLTSKNTIVLEDGRGRTERFNANAGTTAPETESPGSIRDNTDPSPVEVRPDKPPKKIGAPKLPPRTLLRSPGYPKAPPHVLLVSRGVDETSRETWGTGFRRTKKALPLSVKWADLRVNSHGYLDEVRSFLDGRPTSAKTTSPMLNVFVSEHDIAAGLDVDRVRAKAKELSPNVRGVRILFAQKPVRNRR